MSELKLVQVNTITNRINALYSVFGNVASIDVPFQVGNAANLGMFMREWTLETARVDSDVDSVYGAGASPSNVREPAAERSTTHPSLVLRLLVTNVRVHTGPKEALDFLYEIPQLGLEADAQVVREIGGEGARDKER